jgi:hypothetical protein
MLAYLVGGIIVAGLPTLPGAAYREYHKFLAVAFLVSGGMPSHQSTGTESQESW